MNRVILDLTDDQLRDLKELLRDVGQQAPTITGGSSVSMEARRQADSFKVVYEQLQQDWPEAPGG
jgi:hypothetical protein